MKGPTTARDGSQGRARGSSWRSRDVDRTANRRTSQQRKHRGAQTVAGEQLAMTWEVPPASPATTDFVCWLWAAFPPNAGPAGSGGRLNVSRIAKALDVSTTTVRRWIAKDDPKLRAQQIAKLHQRAILRGRGHYLWPDLDPVTRRRSELLYVDAVRNDELITTEPDRVAETWRTNGTLQAHEVHLVYFPRAHAFGVSATTHDKARAKVARFGEILETTVVGNKFAAIALKHEILSRVDEHRCITPRHLVPTGRTETWREAGGRPSLRRPLEVTVVRFQPTGTRLRRFAQVASRLSEDHQGARVVDRVVSTAQEACEALCEPADAVILTSHGYTRQTWRDMGTKRPWPGGRWYVGGRGAGDAGMSLDELAAGLEQLGGLQAPLVVVDACEAAAGTSALRRAARAQQGSIETSVLLLTEGSSSWARELSDLSALIGRLNESRDVDQALADVERYDRI